MGLTDPTLKNKKVILQTFCQLAFFNLLLLKKIFEEKKKNKHINNQKQEAFILIITNDTFSVLFLCLLCKIIFFLKNIESKNQIILFYSAERLTLFFSLSFL